MNTLNFLRPREEFQLLGLPKPLMLQVIVQTPLMTGISPREFVDLQVEDVSWDYGLLFVWRSKVSRDHPVKVDTETMWMIWRYLDKRKTGPLLPWKESPRMKVQRLRRVVKRMAREAGLLRWRRVTPYTLRHTFCIKWVLGGGTLEGLRRQLGHRSLQKLRVYLDFDYRYVEMEYKRIFEPRIPRINIPVLENIPQLEEELCSFPGSTYA